MKYENKYQLPPVTDVAVAHQPLSCRHLPVRGLNLSNYGPG